MTTFQSSMKQKQKQKYCTNLLTILFISIFKIIYFTHSRIYTWAPCVAQKYRVCTLWSISTVIPLITSVICHFDSIISRKVFAYSRILRNPRKKNCVGRLSRPSNWSISTNPRSGKCSLQLVFDNRTPIPIWFVQLNRFRKQ